MELREGTIMHRLKTSAKGQQGFTLTEVLIASSIASLAMALSAVAVMGFRYQGQTTFSQLQTRLQTQSAIEKIGRQIMQSTKVELQGDPNLGEPQFVYLWHDDQEVWTPESTADDIQGVLYQDPGSLEIRYRPDVSILETYEVVSTNIETIKFTTSGKALFVEITMKYDPHFTGSERTILSSFVIRNNPKMKHGGSH